MIASQIVNVQPMTGPVGQIFSFKTRYDWLTTLNKLHPRITMTKAHYRMFLRLNDRKKSQTEFDLDKANYPYVWFFKYNDQKEYEEWCNFQFGAHGYIKGFGRFWFENARDLAAFKMRWDDYDKN